MSTANARATRQSNTVSDTKPGPADLGHRNGSAEAAGDDADRGKPDGGDGDDAGPSSTRGESESAEAPRIRKRRPLGVDPSLIISEERSKRRRTPSPEVDGGGGGGGAEEEGKDDVFDPKDPERAKQLGMEIYSRIMQAKDKEGNSMSEPFVKLPSKRQFPDYYEQIKHPFCLDMVHAKLQAAEYTQLKEVAADLGQIFNNAKRYNVKESALFQYAKKLHKMTRTFYMNSTTPNHDDSESEPDRNAEPGPSASAEPAAAAMQAGTSGEGYDDDVDMGGPSNASADGESNADARHRKRGTYMKDGPTVYKLVKPVLKALREAKARDGSGRDVAGIFEELPDRKLFTDYYVTIKQPISLEEIEERMMGRRYETYEQFFEDVELMCSNAMVYNEDESEVFKDAAQIKDMLGPFRNEIKRRIAISIDQAQKARLKASMTPSRPPPLPGLGPEPGPGQQPVTATPAGYPTNGARPAPPLPSVPSPAPSTFLPALPQGVVTEEVVATLDRYPLYEQQAWATSLPPVAMQVYRQMLAVTEARKRMAQSGGSMPAPQLASLPSTARAAGAGATAMPLQDRQAPPLPTIKYLDFAFASAGEEAEAHLRQAIRLHNLRGVVTHAVVVGSETSEIELTAYIAAARSKVGEKDGGSGAASGEGKGAGDGGDGGGGSGSKANGTAGMDIDVVAAIENVPELSLRVNGNQGSLPRFVFSGEERERPSGMRWVVSLPTSRMETKIEVVATKPGALAETSAIYVNRQY